MTTRTGSAVWNGSIKEGAGTLATESGALDGIGYSFAKRFGDEKGTNPEELVGAAHAGCYSMQLSGVLTGAGTRRTRSPRARPSPARWATAASPSPTFT